MTDLLQNLRTGDWLDRQSFDPLRYAIPSIVPEGLSTLVGAPKIGKSWLSLGWALAVSSGGVALSAVMTGEPRPVFLLALEDGDRRLQDRCRSLLGEREPIPQLFTYLTRVEQGRVLDTIGAWLELYGTHAPLVILDTL